jgi:hypothetical protein
MQDDPEGFEKNLLESQRKLERGEEVAVDATTGLYLMRNSKYHDLIVGETGTINMKALSENVVLDDEHVERLKSHIMNFQPPGREEKLLTPRTTPGYVKEVQDIKTGGVRWVFEDWHAEECGIKSICIDEQGRAMPDPDEAKEDNKKGTRRQQPQTQENNQASLTEVSRKLSRVLEMEEEKRVDAMLAASAPIINNHEKTESTEVVPLNKSVLTPAVYKDDIAIIEEEFAIPDFSLSFENAPIEIEEGIDEVDEILVEKSSVNELDILSENLVKPIEKKLPDEKHISDAMLEADDKIAEEEKISSDNENILDDEDKNIQLNVEDEITPWRDDDFNEEEENLQQANKSDSEFFEYEGMDEFLRITATHNRFVEKVFSEVFSKKGVGNIFIDFLENEIMIEKNYFATCVRDICESDTRKKFELDFLTKDSVNIFDGNKLNELVVAMNNNDYFLKYGRGYSRVIFNLLFEIEDVEGVYVSGWYLKMKLTAHDTIAEFIKSFSRGTSITIIASTPREIEAKIKILKNVKRTY